MNVCGGFHFPPAQKTPVNSSSNSQSRRAFVAVSVTDVRLCQVGCFGVFGTFTDVSMFMSVRTGSASSFVFTYLMRRALSALLLLV